MTPERERAEVLLALEPVDAVSIFDEDTPAEIIAVVQPDVLVKGADWAADQIVGRDTVEARGGIVIREPVVAGTCHDRADRARPRHQCNEVTLRRVASAGVVPVRTHPFRAAAARRVPA